MIIKKRFWWFILYPDSAPANWRDLIIERGLQFCVSPLHDMDVLPTGELKKPHYHVILVYSGPTTYKNVCELTQDALGQTIPKPIDSIRGCYDYLTHKHDVNKAQYDADDIRTYNGFDYAEVVEQSEKDKALLKIKVIEDIQAQHITEYADLCLFYMQQEEYLLFNTVSAHTIFFNRFLASLRHSRQQSAIDKIGELGGN